MTSTDTFYNALRSNRFTVRHEAFNPRYPDSDEYWEVMFEGRAIISGFKTVLDARDSQANLAHGYELALEKIREVIK